MEGIRLVEQVTLFLQKMFSKELVTILVAALPIAELRGAIPLALGKFSFGVYKAYLLSVFGNMLPVLPILLLLESVSKWLCQHSKIAKRFFDWLFERTKKRSKVVEKYGAIGLILFVAIPLPVTGAWTGCVAAFLFGVRRRWAALCILAGVMIAGVIVTVMSLGALKIM
ncbi:MAG: small multi-drug export protein [bacterium]